MASGLRRCHFALFPQQRRAGFASQAVHDLWQSRGKTRAKGLAGVYFENAQIVQDLTRCGFKLLHGPIRPDGSRARKRDQGPFPGLPKWDLIPFPMWHHSAVEFLNFILIFTTGYLVLRRPERERLAFGLLVTSCLLMAALFLIGARGSILPGLNY